MYYLVQSVEINVLLNEFVLAQDLNMIPKTVPLWKGLKSKPGLRQAPDTVSACFSPYHVAIG